LGVVILLQCFHKFLYKTPLFKERILKRLKLRFMDAIKVLLINYSELVSNQIMDMLYESKVTSSYRVAENINTASFIINWYQPNLIILNIDRADKSVRKLLGLIENKKIKPNVVILTDHNFAVSKTECNKYTDECLVYKKNQIVNIKSILENKIIAA